MCRPLTCPARPHPLPFSFLFHASCACGQALHARCVVVVQGTVLNIEPTRTILLDDENGCIGELHAAP